MEWRQPEDRMKEVDKKINITVIEPNREYFDNGSPDISPEEYCRDDKDMTDEYMQEFLKKKTTSQLISEECDMIKAILLDKNAKYGNSAFNNGIIFDVPPLTALKARINDKASRIKQAQTNEDSEDALLDILGYIILYRIKEREERGVIL